MSALYESREASVDFSSGDIELTVFCAFGESAGATLSAVEARKIADALVAAALMKEAAPC